MLLMYGEGSAAWKAEEANPVDDNIFVSALTTAIAKQMTDDPEKVEELITFGNFKSDHQHYNVGGKYREYDDPLEIAWNIWYMVAEQRAPPASTDGFQTWLAHQKQARTA
jgi:hypothetical protein